MVNSAVSEFSCDAVRELVEHLEGKENVSSMSCFEAESSQDVIYYKGAEMGSGEEVKVKEEVVASSEDVKVGELGCLIEKVMGNVNLNGAFSLKEEAQAMNSADTVGVKSSMGYHNEKISTTGNVNELGVTSHEVRIGEDESSSESDESESDSSSSSSSSPSSSDDDNEEDDDVQEKEGCNINRKDSGIEEGEILACSADDMVAWSDDEVEGSGPKGPIRSKNELQELPFVPPVNVTIQPHHQTLPVGSISSILGAQVIVDGMEKHNPLNEGSILWITETRTPLGIVDEIFGPVKNPYYIVRYNSEGEVPDGIQQGTLVSFVQEFAHYVLNDKNIYKKGYDASGENDEELSEEGEFSDDEKEAEYRRMMKMKKRGGPTGGNETADNKVRNRRPVVYQKQNQTTAAGGGGGNVCNGNTGVPPVDQTQPAQGSTLTHQPAQFHGVGSPSSGGGMTCQQLPQNSWSPSFPMMQPTPQQMMMMMSFPGMNMQWAPQNLPQPMFNMPMGNVQGNAAGPLFPANFMVPGGQPPGFGMFNQQQSLGQSLPMVNPSQQMLQSPNAPQNGSPFGQALPTMNLSQQMVPPNAPQGGTSNNSWLPPASPMPESRRSSDQPRNFRGGRQTNHRGGGRFSGGRGRPQNN